MPEYELEVSRHKPPRQECIDAGWDFPHEGPGLVILAGESDCPVCAPKAMQKMRMRLDMELLDEQKRTNSLKDKEMVLAEEGVRWVEPRQQPRPTYIVPPATPNKPKARGGMNIEPRRNQTT